MDTTDTYNDELLDEFFFSLSSMSSVNYNQIVETDNSAKIKDLVASVKNKWDILVKYSNDVIVTFDKNFIIDFINKPELKFLYPGSSFLNWIHPLDIHKVKEKIGYIEVEKKSISFECREVSGNYYDFKLTPQIKEDNVEGFILIASDINEKKEAQQLLAESEERYRSFFSRNLAGLYRATLDNVIVECNDEFAKIIGFNSSREVAGKQTFNLYKNNKEVNIVKLLQANNGNIKGHEYEIILKNGENKWIIENASIIRSEISGEEMVEGSIFEITDLKRLKLEADRLAKFPEENPNPVFRLTPNLDFLYANKAGEAILPDLIVEGKLIGELRNAIYCGLEIKQPMEIELKVGVKFFLFSIKPEWDSEAYINIYLRDISPRKRGEILKQVSFKILRESITNSLVLSDYCEIIKLELAELFDTSHMYYSILNDNEKHISYGADEWNSVQDNKGVERIYLNQYLIKEGIPFLLDREELLSLEKNHNIFLPQKLCEHLISVPIMKKNFPIGALVVKLFDEKQKFIKGDLDLMVHIANLLSEVIEKSKIYEQLKKSEEEHRGLVERNLSGVYRLDIDGKVMDCNNAFCKIIGYDFKEQVIGKNYNELYTNLTVEDFIQEIVKNGGILHGRESNLLLNDKRTIWVLENVSIIYNIRNWPMYIEGTVMEVTNQKENLLILQQEKKLALEMQSKLLSSQINPHFIFNSLNSVQYYILEQKIEPALNYISEFSSLMRKALNNSQNKYITFKEEIEFLRLYLQLEQKRFSNKFSYEICFEDSFVLEEELIPPMLLQPYIENSIVHGVGNKKDNGQLKIEFIALSDATMLCQIEDNGVGREKASELKQLRKGPSHKSMAMQIMDTRISTLIELENNLYSINIEDVQDEKGNLKGTRVSILFPRHTQELWD